MSELGFIFLVCWDISGIMIGCVVAVDVCVDVNDCDGAMNDCEDAVVAWCVDNDDIVMLLWMVVMMLLLLEFVVGCNADWKDHLINQNH